MDKVTDHGGDVLPPALDRWLTGLRAGFVAYRLCESSPADTAQFRDNLRRLLQSELGSLGALSVDGRPRLQSLSCLPVQSLHTLTSEKLRDRLAADALLNEIPYWTKALHNVTHSQREGRPALVNSSKLMAALLLDSHCSPYFLMQFGRQFVSDQWSTAAVDDNWYAIAEVALAKLRSPITYNNEMLTTLTRVEALNDFYAAIAKPNLWYWGTIENSVYHQLYAWPLLVFETADIITKAAFSLPVGVDVRFDGQNKVIRKPWKSVHVDVTQWEKEFGLAVEVAKALWRSKHGGVSLYFRDTINNASVTFDFQLAERVLEGLPFGLALTDRSMGAYLAQVVLHRFLGRSTSLNTAVTGEIGERRRGRDGTGTLDYTVGPVGWISQKVRYVFESRLFSKLVLPEAGPREYPRQPPGDPITELSYCHYMSNIADAVQVNGWRQYTYIRCPDIMYALHERSKPLLAANDPEVGRVRTLLSSNGEPVVKLPPDINFSAVIAYLRHVNFVVRENLNPIPPTLSWAFVRAVTDENDRRLWETIWRVIGASRSDLKRLRNATTSTQVAEHLARALNTFTPYESCPSHRAPDLLIICCSNRLEAEHWKKGTLAYRPHRFPVVIDALKRRSVLPSPIEKLRDFIGHTRVLVVEQGSYDIGGEYPPSVRGLDSVMAGILARLAVFRFGFTQSMASVLLHELNYGVDIRDILKRLTDMGYIGAYGGEYWVRGNIGEEGTPMSVSALNRAKWRWAAAKAFAPYLSSEAAPGLSYSESFLAENVHEATFHLQAAADAAIEVRRTEPDKLTGPAQEAERLRRTVRAAQATMYRFIEMPTLSCVEALTKNQEGLPKRAAWDLAKELWKEKKDLGITPPPSELVGYARACQTWLEQLVRSDAAQEKREDTAATIESIYQAATSSALGTTSQDLEDRLTVLTNYGYFTAMFIENGRASTERRDELRRRLKFIEEGIDKLLMANVQSPAIEAKWFEVSGDMIASSDDAAQRYREGTRNAPLYYTCWVKFAGARRQLGIPVTAVAEEIADLPFELRHKIYLWTKDQSLPIRSGLDRPWNTDRWHAGVDVIRVLVEQ